MIRTPSSLKSSTAVQHHRGLSDWLISLKRRLQLPGSGDVAQADENQVPSHLQPAPERDQLGP